MDVHKTLQISLKEGIGVVWRMLPTCIVNKSKCFCRNSCFHKHWIAEKKYRQLHFIALNT